MKSVESVELAEAKRRVDLVASLWGINQSSPSCQLDWRCVPDAHVRE